MVTQANPYDKWYTERPIQAWPEVQPGDLTECQDKRQKCKDNTACKVALGLYDLNCKTLHNSLPTITCGLCKMASGALSVISEGYSLLHCDCHNDTDCKLEQSKVDECLA